jgi:hypothetical protein
MDPLWFLHEKRGRPGSAIFIEFGPPPNGISYGSRNGLDLLLILVSRKLDDYLNDSFLLNCCQSDSKPIGFYGNDCSRFQIFSMEIDNTQTGGSLLSCSNIDQSDNSRMWHAIENSQFSKILIECYKYPALPMGTVENLIITGVIRPLSCPNDIVAGTSQFVGGSSPNARIQKELHVPVSSRNGSTRSWPTTLRA